MSQSPDELKLRRLLQRVKQADEECTPAFDDVLNQHARSVAQTSPGTMAIAFGCLAASALFIALLGRATVRNESVAPNRQVVKAGGPVLSLDASQSDNLNQVDFDYLNQLVDDHFAVTPAEDQETATNFGTMRIWSSDTDSLLALKINDNLNSE